MANSSQAIDIDLVQELKDVIVHFDDHSHGRPSRSQGMRVLRVLLKRAEEGTIGTFPQRLLVPISRVLVDTSDPTSSIDDLDVVTCWVWDLVKTVSNDVELEAYAYNDASTHRSADDLIKSIDLGDNAVVRETDPFIAAIDLPGTPSGMGRLRVVFPKEWKNVYPFLKGTYASYDGTRDSYVLDRVDIASTVTPGTWFSPGHFDAGGGPQPIAHLGGEKLWITFPRTEHNRSLMEPTARHAYGLDNVDFVDVLPNLEQVTVQIFRDTDRLAFILRSFEYHACLCLKTSVHIGGPTWFQSLVTSICETHEFDLDLWSEELEKDQDLAGSAQDRLEAVIAPLELAAEGDPKLEDCVRAFKTRVGALYDKSQDEDTDEPDQEEEDQEDQEEDQEEGDQEEEEDQEKEKEDQVVIGAGRMTRSMAREMMGDEKVAGRKRKRGDLERY